MAASEYTGNQILNAFLRAEAPSLPGQLYVGLHVGDPGVDGINEVHTDNWPTYVRQNVIGGGVGGGTLAEAFTTPENKMSTNTQRLEFGVMDGASVVTVTYFALWDAPNGGHLYFQGPLLDAKSLSPTDECLINPGKLQVVVN
jgi:hypothetical protein